jgi:hypothetical protein
MSRDSERNSSESPRSGPLRSIWLTGELVPKPGDPNAVTVRLASDVIWTAERIELLMELPLQWAGATARVSYRHEEMRVCFRPYVIAPDGVILLQEVWPLQDHPMPAFDPGRLTLELEVPVGS